MSLRKPPTMTPARLAANRANAAKSTGPRKRAGKKRVRWSALKRGEDAQRAIFFAKQTLNVF